MPEAVGGTDILDALVTADPTINIDEVLREVMRLLDGPTGFAKHIVDDYKALKPGAPLREKIAGHLLGLMERRSSGEAWESDDLETLEALHKELVANDG